MSLPEPPTPNAAPAHSPSRAPQKRSFKEKLGGAARTTRSWIRDYFFGEDPTIGTALVPMCFLSMLLYTRNPLSNFIFDEQEALLANPYVRSVEKAGSSITWVDAFTRDFWGLTPERTIGSYRPIPDLIWRGLWALGARDKPFLHHWVGVLLHGVCGALIVMLVLRLTKRRGMAWMSGAIFVASAIITEAVTGVVGIADVVGGLGAILGLLALTQRAWVMPLGVFVASMIGLYSKETALVMVPLVPLAALLTAQMTHPERPRRWMRAALALTATLTAFYIYVESRRELFPVRTPPEFAEDAACMPKPSTPPETACSGRADGAPCAADGGTICRGHTMCALCAVDSDCTSYGTGARCTEAGACELPAPTTCESKLDCSAVGTGYDCAYPEGATGGTCELKACPGVVGKAKNWFIRWYAQPGLPRDPINNPLIAAPRESLRHAGGLRVYWRGLAQVVFPWTLSGDYSSPQEPTPERFWFPESVLGLLCFVVPVVLLPVFGVLAWLRFRREHPRPKDSVAWRMPIAVVLFYGAWFLAVLGLKGDIMASPWGVLRWSVPDWADPEAWQHWLNAFALGAVMAGFLLTVLCTFVALKDERHPRRRISPRASPYRDGEVETDEPPRAPTAAEIDLRPLVALSLGWIAISFFPVSNIPLELPTVRAERFWYFPIIGSAIALGIFFARVHDVASRVGVTARRIVTGVFVLFLGFQCYAARRHAFDYNNDLQFWNATRKAVPNSCKAHLNYSVMVGARGDMKSRYEANLRGYELAPKWPMASVYLGDTLCRWALGAKPESSTDEEWATLRKERLDEAMEDYLRGFDLAPNDINLLALGLACVWDADLFKEPPAEQPEAERASSPRQRLIELGNKHPTSWLKWFLDDMVKNGEKNHGIDPKYRPRGYNEGPKE